MKPKKKKSDGFWVGTTETYCSSVSTVFRYMEYNEMLNQKDIFILLDLVNRTIDHVRKEYDHEFIASVAMKKHELKVEILINDKLYIDIEENVPKIFDIMLYNTLKSYSSTGIELSTPLTDENNEQGPIYKQRKFRCGSVSSCHIPKGNYTTSIESIKEIMNSINYTKN